MKRFLSLIPILLLTACGTFPASAANTIITATITVTNTAGTTNGQTLTVNSVVKTWTNSLVIPANQILTNNTIFGCATNLFNAISVGPFLNLSLGQLTNGVSLQTLTVNGPMVVTLSSGWGTVVLTTNTLTSAQVVRVPLTVEYPSNQTSIATYLAQGLESSTYGISAAAPVLSNMVNVTQGQTITGVKRFFSPWLTNATIVGPFVGSPITTNLINYGNALSSPGTNATSEQFGLGAATTGAQSLSVGYNAYSSAGSTALGFSSQGVGIYSMGIGPSTVAFGNYSLALGYGAQAQNSNSISIGVNSAAIADFGVNIGVVSESSGYKSSALGYNSWGQFDYSTAIGYNATTTGTNQVRLGTANDYVSIPGGLQVSGSTSNVTFSGTNTFPTGSDIAFKRFAVTTLANGNNAGIVVGTNVFIQLSGPSAAFNVNGIAGGRDGKLIILLNRTGQNMTIAHDSGVEPTAANRIYTARASDSLITGNCSATLIYSANDSRWILLFMTQ